MANLVKTFQGTKLDDFKVDVDAWLLANTTGNEFTKATFEIQDDTRNIGRALTLTLFYNEGGAALATPFVFNYLTDTSVADLVTAYEAFLVANPVAANFYGNMFVFRTDPVRKLALNIYAFITNTDQAAAGANWTAANDIT